MVLFGAYVRRLLLVSECLSDPSGVPGRQGRWRLSAARHNASLSTSADPSLTEILSYLFCIQVNRIATGSARQMDPAFGLAPDSPESSISCLEQNKVSIRRKNEGDGCR
jgi:hypothetical protein